MQLDRLVDYVGLFQFDLADADEPKNECYWPEVEHADLTRPAKLYWFAKSPLEVGKNMVKHCFVHSPKASHLYGFCCNFIKNDTLFVVSVLSRLSIDNVTDALFDKIYKETDNLSDLDYENLKSICDPYFNSFLNLPMPIPGLFSCTIPSFAVEAAFYPEGGLPNLIHTDFTLDIFKAIPNRELIEIFAALLQEVKVLIVSKDPKKLTCFCEFLICLIKPLRWQHVFIPYLPSQLYDVLDAPVPFVMGVCTRIDNMTPLIVDLDAGSIVHQDVGIGKIPLEIRNRLHLMLNELDGVDNYMDGFTLSFMEAMASILSGYKESLNSAGFNKKHFLSLKILSKKEVTFYENLLDSNMFEHFIDSKKNWSLFSHISELNERRKADQLLQATSNLYKNTPDTQSSDSKIYSNRISPIFLNEYIKNLKETTEDFSPFQLTGDAKVFATKKLSSVDLSIVDLPMDTETLAYLLGFDESVLITALKHLRNLIGTKNFDARRKGSFDPSPQPLFIDRSTETASPKKRPTFTKRIKSVQTRPSLVTSFNQNTLVSLLDQQVRGFFLGSDELELTEQDMYDICLKYTACRVKFVSLLNQESQVPIVEDIFPLFTKCVRKFFKACGEVLDYHCATKLLNSLEYYHVHKLVKSHRRNLSKLDRRRSTLQMVELGQVERKQKARGGTVHAGLVGVNLWQDIVFWKYFFVFNLKSSKGSVFQEVTKMLNVMVKFQVTKKVADEVLQAIQMNKCIDIEELSVLKNLFTNLSQLNSKT